MTGQSGPINPHDEAVLRAVEERCPNRCGKMERNAEGFWQCPACECISVTRYIDSSDFDDYPHGIIR